MGRSSSGTWNERPRARRPAPEGSRSRSFADGSGGLLLDEGLVARLDLGRLSLRQLDLGGLAADLDAQFALEVQRHVRRLDPALFGVEVDGALGVGALEVGALDLEGQAADARRLGGRRVLEGGFDVDLGVLGLL